MKYIPTFSTRHIGVHNNDRKDMLTQLNADSLDAFIDTVIPSKIRLTEELAIDEPLSEADLLDHLKLLAQKNTLCKNYIGMGYHPTHTPSVILRNILENPGWYTAYTPYQAEIAQGRLEALINFQTMVIDLTGMEVANASLLDEGTAAAEAMQMLYNNRKNKKAIQFFISDGVLPQTLAILQTKAQALGIEIIVDAITNFNPTEEVFALFIQYPSCTGNIENYTEIVANCKTNNIGTIFAADLLALTLLTPPGEWGADVVVGTTQRFGIPLGFGGPHAAYFATLDKYKRAIPGRVIGLSKDINGKPAYRMALQTREQHIKREKATSNICTAQVLLAVMAGMFAVYHGPKGLAHIAKSTHQKTQHLAHSLPNSLEQINTYYFDTLCLKTPDAEKIYISLQKESINIFLHNENTISISLNETTTWDDVTQLITILKGENKEIQPLDTLNWEPMLLRTSPYLEAPVFNTYHTETEMMRYIKRLERKDLALNHSMISLGSCTMKLNAATEMLPLSWPEWSQIHPFQPTQQTTGYLELIQQLEKDLSTITGFAATSLQPNSGAQGEYAGLLVIKKYFEKKGENQRNIVLIPASAHGTNPASATVAGLEVIVIKTLENGNIDITDLETKATLHQQNLCALMLTYPSTHGVFEDHVLEVTQLVHKYGGQIYMDGANMNAQVGYTNPAKIGADVCHLNLHKTFAIPHGGGGPGVGPICVAQHLAEFLPSNPIVQTGGKNSLAAISSAPYGSALVLLISYSYIKLLGKNGLKEATALAILNANYLKRKLEDTYSILYTANNGTVGHEMIIDFRPFKTIGIEVVDIAKRLMDYGFHAPTVSFPVAGTLMIEPTESECKAEIDRFSDALLAIYKEIKEIKEGHIAVEDSMLKNAPHTLQDLTQNNWNQKYTREEAAYPLPYVADNKFWPSVKRIDEAYGDRNLICSCINIEAYE